MAAKACINVNDREKREAVKEFGEKSKFLGSYFIRYIVKSLS